MATCAQKTKTIRFDGFGGTAGAWGMVYVPFFFIIVFFFYIVIRIDKDQEVLFLFIFLFPFFIFFHPPLLPLPIALHD